MSGLSTVHQLDKAYLFGTSASWYADGKKETKFDECGNSGFVATGDWITVRYLITRGALHTAPATVAEFNGMVVPDSVVGYVVKLDVYLKLNKKAATAAIRVAADSDLFAHFKTLPLKVISTMAELDAATKP